MPRRRVPTSSARVEVLQTVLDNMSDGIVLFDKDLRLRFINHQLVGIQRYPTEVARSGTSVYDLLRFQTERGELGPDDVERIIQEWAVLVLKPGAIAMSGGRQAAGLSNSTSSSWMAAVCSCSAGISVN